MSYKTRLLSALREQQSKEHGVHVGTVVECIKLAEAIPEDDGISELKEITKIFNCSASDPAELKRLLNRLQSWANAEREGRLVVLPCKTGDTIYQLRGKRHAQGVGISPRTVSCAHVWSNGDYSLSHQGTELCLKKDLGKTWFLTREGAEALLKGENHETDSF